MKKILVFCCFLLLLLCSCNKEQQTDSLMENYPRLTDASHVITEITGAEAVNKIDNQETFILMMGFPSCPWCQQLLPILDATAKEQNVTEIYYLDIKDMRDNETSVDRSYYLTLYTYCLEALDKEKDRINAPTVIAVKNGELMGYHLDTVEGHVKDETGTLPELTTEQTALLKSELIDLMNLIK